MRQFLVHAGDYGGYMPVETDNSAAIHKLTSSFPALAFRVDTVLELNDAAASSSKRSPGAIR